MVMKMKQEKHWVLFQIAVHGIQTCWIPSDRKLTSEEAHQIMRKGDFNFDLTPLGLDMFGSFSLIIGFYIVRGTKKDAEQQAHKLNETGGSPFKFYDGDDEELDWCESETNSEDEKNET